jgi:hypothetical protein
MRRAWLRGSFRRGVWPATSPKESVWATVRGGHPGDWCRRADGTWERIETTEGEVYSTAVKDSIPIAAIDACGTEYTDLADPPEAAIPFVLGIGYKFKSAGAS